MNISKLFALSVSVTSASAAAFQANDSHRPALVSASAQDNRAFPIADNLITQRVTPAASPLPRGPIAGCNCPFCSLLRNQR